MLVEFVWCLPALPVGDKGDNKGAVGDNKGAVGDNKGAVGDEGYMLWEVGPGCGSFLRMVLMVEVAKSSNRPTSA